MGGNGQSWSGFNPRYMPSRREPSRRERLSRSLERFPLRAYDLVAVVDVALLAVVLGVLVVIGYRSDHDFYVAGWTLFLTWGAACTLTLFAGGGTSPAGRHLSRFVGVILAIVFTAWLAMILSPWNHIS